MILLTEGGINELCENYTDYTITRETSIARAQIKKIARWGDEECPHGKMLKRECYDCWQVLREICL